MIFVSPPPCHDAWVWGTLYVETDTAFIGCGLCYMMNLLYQVISYYNDYYQKN